MNQLLELLRTGVDRAGIRVVENVSFRHSGKGWIGVVGANGSGKTTLLRAVAGRLAVASGGIELNGVDVTADRSLRANAIGFAVDSTALPGELTPREIFYVAAYGQDGGLEAPVLSPLRRALNLDRFIDQKSGSLSAGTAQRVSIFAAFLGLPQIVILDEPFNWLDPLTAYDVKLALSALVNDGLLLITALHDISTLTAYCTRGFLMSRGRLSLTMEREDLQKGLRDPVSFERYLVDQLRAS